MQLAIYLTIAIFSIPILMITRSSLLLFSKTSSSSMPYLSSISAPAMYHNVIRMDLDCLFLPQGITLVYYTDDIMPSGPSEQEVATTLD